MTTSAIIMLVIASFVLYGGLFITVNRAVKSSKNKKKNN